MDNRIPWGCKLNVREVRLENIKGSFFFTAFL